MSAQDNILTTEFFFMGSPNRKNKKNIKKLKIIKVETGKTEK